MDYQLVVVRGRSGSKGALKLGNGITTVGRQEDCQLRINSSQVSRKHCQIFEKKGLLLVKDLGSSNGTFVNGQKIKEQRVLEPGDELTIGQVKFRVERLPSSSGVRPAGVQSPSDTAIAAASPQKAEGGVADEDVFDFDFDQDASAASSLSRAAASAPAQEDAFSFTPDADQAGEDAVAEFLLNVEFEDEDRP